MICAINFSELESDCKNSNDQNTTKQTTVEYLHFNICNIYLSSGTKTIRQRITFLEQVKKISPESIQHHYLTSFNFVLIALNSTE